MSGGGNEHQREKADIDELIRKVDRLFSVMRKARATSAAAAGNSLSPSQVALIEPLLAEPELPVGRLAEAAGVAVPSATRMLQQLEGKGMLARRRSPDDDRQVLIRLTTYGRTEIAAVRAALRSRQVRRLRTLSAGQCRDLIRSLDLLIPLITEESP
ncbi:MarR family winged helix-turn-helix transcriptional regulator [Amycolatopsis pithecellobii]|uniref:MarR family transcriptional regulator n=1 Tax=Amycolatopsis pithecellobii TaxID=664692 RepID=A0A6N7YZI5_9PSEU|nr:MarR family transcriptional regulator [Amycolatopsis pithecellobii]MTD52630.1 MarR family transcriptional regulator [Amycolatopsis pithecellobii]